MEHSLLAAKYNFEEGSTLWVQIVTIQNEISKIFFFPSAAYGFIGSAVERLCLGGVFSLVTVRASAIARLAFEALKSDVYRLDKKYFSVFQELPKSGGVSTSEIGDCTKERVRNFRRKLN